ncbi:MAG: glycosyltransferase family 4 protein [Acidobacteriia bacterium]|nr:glycosyltransferase family 4 protein [Terriglobia bacterium]
MNDVANGQKLGVMHLVDTLEVGGAERVAVTLVNHLDPSRYLAHLCSTRREGPLAFAVDRSVRRLKLNRRWRFDVGPVFRLQRYIQRNQISILHAHGSTVFLARLIGMFPPYPAVIWHTHYGRFAVENRKAPAYAAASRGIQGVIVVNRELGAWCQDTLHVPAERVWYVPNPVAAWKPGKDVSLPGTQGSRIVCLANIRPEKDHLTLVRSMAQVAAAVPEAHLMLVGSVREPELLAAVQSEIKRLNLTKNISYLGSRQDAADILDACDVGVLSSASEGLPMALLEYGRAGLAVVATTVGECEEVLGGGSVGMLVRPGSDEELASALITLLQNPHLRARLGASFRQHVEDSFDATKIAASMDGIYQTALDAKRENQVSTKVDLGTQTKAGRS